MRFSSIVAVVGVVVSIALAFLLYLAQHEASLARAEIEALRAATNALSDQIAELQKVHVDEAELARLQADAREAIRLRGEVNNLRKTLASNPAAKPAAPKPAETKPAPAAAVPVEQNPAVRILNSKVVSNLQPGHAMVIGGWDSKPGKKAFAFVTPTVDPANPNTVTVEAKWVEANESSAATLNLNNLLTSAGQGSLTPEQFATLLKAMEQTDGVDLLAAPKVTTLSGRQASVAVTEVKPTPGGDVAFGPMIDLVPTQREDGSVDLAVDAKLTLPANPE